MKKLLALFLVLILSLSMVASLAEGEYIAVISKGFQHQFWQTVAAGANKAAEEHKVTITFDGPPSESDINIQVDMLNAALAKNPVALALAALDTEAVTEQLLNAKGKGIPVVGFDSGVPNAPEGTIVSTASTDNEAAGALAAEQMYAVESIAAKIAAATPEAPVLISCFSQEATSASIVGRTVGFLNKMKEQLEAVHPGAVAIAGHDRYNVASEQPAAVTINVTVPASTGPADAQTSAQGILAMEHLIAVFCTNEASVGGILAATTDGSDLDRDNGKYKDLLVIGFDAGANQKAAVKNQWFYGSVTQDPYMIGYYAVELAAKAFRGETLEPLVDTGCRFYTYENIDDEMIAPLLYD